MASTGFPKDTLKSIGVPGWMISDNRPMARDRAHTGDEDNHPNSHNGSKSYTSGSDKDSDPYK